MKVYHLKWPDGQTAAIVVHSVNDKVESLTVTGTRSRLAEVIAMNKKSDVEAYLRRIVESDGVVLKERTSA